MRKQTFLALLISVLLVNGFFSTNIIKSNHKFYANQIDDLISNPLMIKRFDTNEVFGGKYEEKYNVR